MFAVVQIGSSQFKVSEGDTISADCMGDKVRTDVKIDKRPEFPKGSDVRIGQPYLKDVKVTAKVVEHDLDDKVTAFKYRRRKDSSSKVGHRQKLTSLNITQIAA